MKMMQRAAMAVTILASFAAVPASAASIVYTGSQQVGTIAATYSITTDGSLGNLNARSIQLFDVTLTNGASTIAFNNNVGSVRGFFTATATNLSINRVILAELDFATSGITNNLFDGVLIFTDSFTQAQIGSLAPSTFSNQNSISFATAPAVVITPTPAVPEPATWAMMIVGFGTVGGAMRRRKSKVTTTVAYA